VRSGRFAAAAAVTLALALAAGARTATGADLVQVEGVGAVPAGGETARQDAIDAGVREAVLRVAEDLAREGGATTDDPDALRAALGSDLFSYAVRYELREDRGERAAQLVQEPGVDREYDVVVAVQVDRGRVRERLMRAGLLGPAAGGPTRTLSVTFDGVDRYPTWERLERALSARGGPVRPVEFARGMVVAEIDTDESNDALVQRLRRAVGDSLGLAVESSEGATLRLRAVPAASPVLDVPGGGAAAPPAPPASPGGERSGASPPPPPAAPGSAPPRD
jgi:hypothetical protein